MRSSRRRSAWVPVALLLLGGAAGCTREQGMEKITLAVGNAEFRVEVARTDAERQQGLMRRESLGRREGMLFVFDRDEHLDFWMKDTTIPLSIAFLSKEGRILEIADMVPLSRKPVRSRLSGRYALELNKGAFAEVGAREGSVVVFPPGFDTTAR